MSGILESLMLIAFGASWPAQILKTIRVKNPQGKSFIFLYLVMFGYLCGIVSKFVPGGTLKWGLVALYLLDFLMVATDTMLSHYYLARLRSAGAINRG